jgi:hypothetical protein
LGNEAIFANEKLIVTDKYTLKDATKVAQADAKVIEQGVKKSGFDFFFFFFWLRRRSNRCRCSCRTGCEIL